MERPPYVEAGAPPSSYAIADVLEGKPGAWLRVGGLTLLRATFILPGLMIAGVRGPRAVGAALASSVTLSGLMLGLYAFDRAEMARQEAGRET